MDLSRGWLVAMGIGFGTVSADGVAYASGGGTQWIDDDTIIYQRQDTVDGPTSIETRHLPTGIVTVVRTTGANHLVAGGGVWACWTAGDGYRDSHGRHEPAWYPLAVDDSGAIAVCLDYAAGRDVAIVTGSSVEAVSGGTLDALEACFREGVLIYRRTLPAVSGVQHDGFGVALGWHEGHGLVAYRIGSPLGLVLSSDGRDFHARIRKSLTSEERLVVSSSGAGERPEELRRYLVDMDAGTVNGKTASWVDLRTVPVQAIGRPCWLGWFSYGVHSAPGNCRVDVTQGQPWLAVTAAATGETIARYVSAAEDSDLDQLAAVIRVARAAAPALPVLAYWTWPAQRLTDSAGRLLAVPDAEIVGVECYRKAHEDMALFERRCSAALDRVAQAGRMAAIVAQAYSSNATNHSDLAALVPVYARLAAAHPHVVGVLAFSAGHGRATGWEDHTEIHEAWRALFAGIPSAPVIERPEPPTPKPPVVQPPVTPIPPPAGGSFRRLHMTKLVGLRRAGVFLSSEPGHTDIETRDVPAPTAWQKVRMHDLPSQHVRFEFESSGLTLAVNDAGSFETRPPGTDGPWETFIAGIAPSGERVAFRSDLVGPVLEVVEVAE